MTRCRHKTERKACPRVSFNLLGASIALVKARSTRRGDPSPHVVANMAESLEDPLAVRLIYYKFHTLSRSNSRYMLLVPPRTAPPLFTPRPSPPPSPTSHFPLISSLSYLIAYI